MMTPIRIRYLRLLGVFPAAVSEDTNEFSFRHQTNRGSIETTANAWYPGMFVTTWLVTGRQRRDRMI
jgi:hypothetical protein